MINRPQDLLTPTGHVDPKHIVSAAACIANEQGQVLLVRTQIRSDTWEMPGGQVEVGEPPHLAAMREVCEETGVQVSLNALVGVYFSETRDIVNLVFRGQSAGGALRPAEGEILEAGFFSPHEALERVTRPHFHTRLADALAGFTAAYESFRQPGYQRERLEP
ncbi:MAG: NUDIX hydrolase [Bacillota bacterium]